MTSSSYTGDRDRRRAVRIEDRVLLGVRPLTSEEYQAIAASYQEGRSLYNQETLGDAHLYLGSHQALANLKEKDEDLAAFLLHLDFKLNRLLDALSAAESPMSNLMPRQVSLSGGGLAFVGEERYEPESRLEIQLVLLPDYIHFYIIGRVVSCLPQDGGHRTAVEFDLIMDEDRERIVQHLFRLQHLALRARRERQQRSRSQ